MLKYDEVVFPYFENSVKQTVAAAYLLWAEVYDSLYLLLLVTLTISSDSYQKMLLKLYHKFQVEDRTVFYSIVSAVLCRDLFYVAFPFR